MPYFEKLVRDGEWDDVEKYLGGFTEVNDSAYSVETFFEIRKQKYLEALDKNDHDKTFEILNKDLNGFSDFDEDVFMELTNLLTLENIRDDEELSEFGDTNLQGINCLLKSKG